VKVLEGVRVVEQGTFITGPCAAMLLADLGIREGNRRLRITPQYSLRAVFNCLSRCQYNFGREQYEVSVVSHPGSSATRNSATPETWPRGGRALDPIKESTLVGGNR